jgi:poly(A) polymerase
MMHEDGVLAIILREAKRLDRLQQMIAIEPEADPLRRLAALIEVDAAGAIAVAERLRFSNAWRDRLRGLAPPWAVDPRANGRAQRRALYRLGGGRYSDIALLLAAEGAMSGERLTDLLALARNWIPPVFPLTGHHVTRLGVRPGEKVGDLLDAVQDWWEAGDYSADHTACLARLKELVNSTR